MLICAGLTRGQTSPLSGRGGSQFTESLPLLPTPVPVFTSRSALAPKLIRRAKGDVGDPFGAASLSSTAFSSIEPPLERLSCLALAWENVLDWVGDPESPNDVIDILRRCWAWAFAAAVAMGLGYNGGPLLVGERPRSSESFCPGENEARRADGTDGVSGGELLSLDMVKTAIWKYAMIRVGLRPGFWSLFVSRPYYQWWADDRRWWKSLSSLCTGIFFGSK